MPPGELFIISAPSGAGKTTLAKRLVAALPDTVLSISHTTRPRRPGERHGEDYFFVDRETFTDMAARDQFLEYATVFGNLYGTSRAAIDERLERGRNVLLDIDWQGARKVRAKMPKVKSIFVLPPSWRELERRLRARDQDSEAEIARRMREAADEMSHCDEYDYRLVNDRLERVLEDLKRIVRGQEPGADAPAVDLQMLLTERSEGPGVPPSVK